MLHIFSAARTEFVVPLRAVSCPVGGSVLRVLDLRGVVSTLAVLYLFRDFPCVPDDGAEVSDGRAVAHEMDVRAFARDG